MRPPSRRQALVLFFAGCGFPLFAIDSRDPAPKFRAKTMQGEALNNDALLGKVVLLQFWATWCQYCRQDQPAMDAIQSEFGSKVTILNVDVGESKKTVQRYLERNPKPGKTILNEDTNLPAMFEAKSYPHYVLIDDRGKIAGEQKGAGGQRALRALLRKAGIVAGEADDFSGRLESSPAKQ